MSENEIRSLFQRYAEAFDAIDGKRIAALYHEPTLTMRGDGSIHVLKSAAAASTTSRSCQ